MTTIKIELPNNWDDLMKDLGYKPLSSYYVKINSVNIPQVNPPVNQKKQQDSYVNNNQTTVHKRPTPEQYRKIRQEKSQSLNSNWQKGYNKRVIKGEISPGGVFLWHLMQ